MVIKNNHNTKLNWIMISIEDPDALPGTSIFEVIKLIQQVINFKFVIIDHIYGALISSLTINEDTPMEMDILLKLLPQVKQFDWGDFFYFKNFQNIGKTSMK